MIRRESNPPTGKPITMPNPAANVNTGRKVSHSPLGTSPRYSVSAQQKQN
jgi:hypothetical protein